jgi:hypothetical protein
MNKTLMFIQADMHRAINDGRRSIEVSILDLKELVAAVIQAEAREQNEKLGIVFGFIRPEQLRGMRDGSTLYCSLRRKKNDEYCEPAYCDPSIKIEVDAIAQTDDNPTHSSD